MDIRCPGLSQSAIRLFDGQFYLCGGDGSDDLPGIPRTAVHNFDCGALHFSGVLLWLKMAIVLGRFSGPNAL